MEKYWRLGSDVELMEIRWAIQFHQNSSFDSILEMGPNLTRLEHTFDPQ